MSSKVADNVENDHQAQNSDEISYGSEVFETSSEEG